jgi:hypothetical protein
MSVLQYFGATVVALGLVLDLLSLVLNVLRARRGHGSSGVPVIPWIFYCEGGVLLKKAMLTSSGLLDLGLLTLFHILSQYALPWAVSRFWRHRAC